MKMMACAVMAMTMLAGAAQAGDWRLLSADDDQIIFIDVSSSRLASGSASGWVSFLYNEQHSDPDIDFSLLRVEMLCSSGLLKWNTIYHYRADGSSVRSSDLSGQFKVPPPDSVGERIVRAFCDRDFPDTTIGASMSEMFSDEAKAAARRRRGN